jgi:outer membrane immunogenic protein
MRSLGLATLAAITISVLPAAAADMSRPVYKAAPAPMMQAYNWSGFYAGIHGGYAWGDGAATVFGLTDFGDVDGWFGGGQIGWNWQAAGSPWVWGIEADLSGSDIGTSASALGITADSTLNMFGTVRGRLGYAWDRVMLYGTGGFAWGRNELSFSGFGTSVSEERTHTGWVAGGGVEWALLDNWTAKIEYQYLMLDSETYFPAVLGGIDLDADIHTIRVGLNYRFGGGYGKSPVMAKY